MYIAHLAVGTKFQLRPLQLVIMLLVLFIEAGGVVQQSNSKITPKLEYFCDLLTALLE